jgi:hypothetical protein
MLWSNGIIFYFTGDIHQTLAYLDIYAELDTSTFKIRFVAFIVNLL